MPVACSVRSDRMGWTPNVYPLPFSRDDILLFWVPWTPWNDGNIPCERKIGSFVFVVVDEPVILQKNT